MQIISTIGLITINETLFIQLISFLIFMFIMNRLMFKPLRGVMAEREDFVQNIQTEVGKAEEELKTLTAQLKEKELKIREDAASLKEELTETGHEEAGVILADARKEIELLMSEAEKDVSTKIQEARKTIKSESKILATAMIERILDRRLVS